MFFIRSFLKPYFLILMLFTVLLHGDSAFSLLNKISKKGILKVIIQEEEPFLSGNWNTKRHSL